MVDNSPICSVVIPYYGPLNASLRSSIDSLICLVDAELLDVVIAWENASPIEVLALENDVSSYFCNFNILSISDGAGLPHSLNLGVSNTLSDYVARLDAGDTVIVESRFIDQVRYLDANPSIWCVGSSLRLCSPSSDFFRDRSYPCSHEKIVNQAYYLNPIAHPTVMYRKSVFDKLGGYDESQYNEDFDLWLRSIKEGYELSNLNTSYVAYELTTVDVGRSRDFLGMLKLRFKYLPSFFKNIFISVPFTFSSYIMFKFPFIFSFVNRKVR